MPVKLSRGHNSLDSYIAKKLRERRIELGLSQPKLAKDLGISPQQIHKYEKNIDKLSASRLYEFSRLLQVPLSYFFEEKNDFPAQDKELLVTCSRQKGTIIVKFLDEKGIVSDLKVNKF